MKISEFKSGKPFKFKAFTLVEVLIAIVIISIALVALYRSNISSFRYEKRASDLTYGVMAADYLMKKTLMDRFPAAKIDEGIFKEGPYSGLKWKLKVESFDLPMLKDMRKITIDVYWGKNDHYRLSTVVSRYR